MNRIHIHRSSSALLALIALALIAGAPTDAAAQEVYFACYTANGLVYRINPPTDPGQDPKLQDACSSPNHQVFSWNAEGVQGPQGEQGPQGDQGPPGPGLVFTAHVNRFGIGSGTGVLSAGRLSTGKFFIVFDRDIALCHRVAGLGHPTEVRLNEDIFEGMPGEISTFASLTGQDRLIVVTRDSLGNLLDKDFHVIVACDS